MSLSPEEKTVMAHFDQPSSVAFHMDPYERMNDFTAIMYQGYESFWVDETNRFMDRLNGNKVLALGCGTGREDPQFRSRGIDHVGIDISQNILRGALSFDPTPRVARMNMRQLGFPDDSFDGVWSFDSFNSMPKRYVGEMLAEVKRVTRLDGVVYINALWDSAAKESAIDGLFTEGWRPIELAETIANAGFTVIDAQFDNGGMGSYAAFMATPKDKTKVTA